MRFPPPVAPPEPEESFWNPVSTAAFVTVCVAVGLLWVLILGDEDAYLRVLDDLNLVFHEAGHAIFGVLGDTMGLYGGTLGQLVFPVVIIGVAAQRREAVGVALSGVWTGENLLNIARYMSDARAQELPLLGGGEHDWTNIFSRWGALHLDTRVGAITKTLGWAGMLAAMGWLAWIWWRARRSRTQ